MVLKKKIFVTCIIVIFILLVTCLFESTAIQLKVTNSTISHKSRVLVDKNPDKIFLKSRQFIPIKGLEISKLDNKHFIIQSDKFLNNEEKIELENKGINFLSYLSGNAWFVSLSETSPTKVINLPNVRYIGDIQIQDKISESIRKEGIGSWAKDENGSVYLNVEFFGDVSMDEAENIVKQYNGKILGRIYSVNALTISLPNESLIISFANDDAVQWIEQIYQIKKALDQSTSSDVTSIDTVQASPYNLNGSGINVLVYDDTVFNHPDLSGRVINVTNSPTVNHATLVAGVVAGDGTLNSAYKGVAPRARIIAYNLSSPPPYNSEGVFIEYNYNESINKYNATISVNPWYIQLNRTLENQSDGNLSNTSNRYSNCSEYGDYIILSQLFDNISRGSLGKPMIVVFASGNERGNTPCGTMPGSLASYENIPPPATAKNMIVVGAINSNDHSMTNFSSFGPVEDGRIKPDLVAPGCQEGGQWEKLKNSGENNSASESIWGPWGNGTYWGSCGTSFSSPHVAGVAALMLQQYNMSYPNNIPLPSTIKAILIQGADSSGQDFQTGYGRLRANSTIDIIKGGNFTESDIRDNNEIDAYAISITGTEPFIRVTLVWDDKPGTPNAAKELVNNLNLYLVSPNGTIYYPYIKDPNDPGATPVRGYDNINNVEQVNISSPESGKWTIYVNASENLEDIQNYSLVSNIKFNYSQINLSIFSVINSSFNKRIFRFQIKNKASLTQNVSWNISFGDGSVMISNQNLTLQSEESAFVIVEHNYTANNRYIVKATAYSRNQSDSQNITIYSGDIIVLDLKIINISLKKRIFEFSVFNNLNANMSTVNWTITFGDGNKANSTQNMILGGKEESWVFVEYNYTSPGPFIVNASARNGTFIASQNITVGVS